METYEEKYKDLVKRLNKAREEKGVYTFNSVLDAVAPELKIEESEDERIKKSLKDCFEWLRDDAKWTDVYGSSFESVFAWLEKQGDKDKLIKELGEYKVKYTQEVLSQQLEKQCKQKQELLIKEKALKNSPFVEQKSAEWSEEDEQLYNDLSDTYFYNDEDYPEETYKLMLKRVLDWMTKRAKSLRPQSHYKPSNEQLDSLYDVLNPCDGFNREVLESLYEDLKKLKQ